MSGPSLPPADVLVIDMQAKTWSRFGPGRHAFTCPECYEHKPCDGNCDCEYDLRLDDGTERCCYWVCDECAAREKARALALAGGGADDVGGGW